MTSDEKKEYIQQRHPKCKDCMADKIAELRKEITAMKKVKGQMIAAIGSTITPDKSKEEEESEMEKWTTWTAGHAFGGPAEMKRLKFKR